jgi:hypothetical protein
VEVSVSDHHEQQAEVRVHLLGGALGNIFVVGTLIFFDVRDIPTRYLMFLVLGSVLWNMGWMVYHLRKSKTALRSSAQ